MKRIDGCPEKDELYRKGGVVVGHRVTMGSTIRQLRLTSIRSKQVSIPDPAGLVHLQFRRFAGCPICDLHLQSIVRRHGELAEAAIREVVVFHSTVEELVPYCGVLPFETVADPEKRLNREFGVEAGLRAVADPRVWTAIVRGVLRSSKQTLLGRTPLPTLHPRGGRLGLPADFLIAPSGMVAACKYGVHAYDQWTVDEILALARRAHSDAAGAAVPVRG